MYVYVCEYTCSFCNYSISSNSASMSAAEMICQSYCNTYNASSIYLLLQLYTLHSIYVCIRV